MATPKKTASGRWQIQVYVGKDSTGKRIYKAFTGDTKKEVERLAKEYLALPKEQTVTLANMTVGDAVDAYIRRREAELSPKTLKEYKAYRQIAFPKLMNTRLLDVDDDLVQREIDTEAKKNAPKTVSLKWGLVGAAIREARHDYTPRIRLPKRRTQRMTMPDAGKLREFLLLIEGHNIEIPVLLATVCGLRRSEIAALDLAKDVNYTRGFIRVNKALVLDEHNNWVLKETKTDAGDRLVICPAWVLDKLAAARDDTSFVLYKPDSISDTYRDYAKKVGMPCTFHGLRHYFASLMDISGVPVNYQMARMGHTTESMLRHYQELLPEKELEVNENLLSTLTALDPHAK